MLLPDVNILVFAHREDSKDHPKYSHWLRSQLLQGERFAVSELVLSSFVRIVTHPRIYDPPSSMTAALTFCENLRQAPGVTVVRPELRHWDILVGLIQQTGIRGADVTDAYLAALAIEHDCEFVTADRGFSRFQGLRWRHPLEPDLSNSGGGGT